MPLVVGLSVESLAPARLSDGRSDWGNGCCCAGRARGRIEHRGFVLRVLLQQRLETPLAREIISGRLHDGQKLVVDEEGGGLVFKA